MNQGTRLIFGLEVVAINHTAPSLDHLLHGIKYDSTHGICRHSKDLSIEDGALFFRGRRIALFSQRDPTLIDWKSAGAEYIAECTGKMTTVESARKHIIGGAKKVVISAPSKDAPTIVVGVNRRVYDPSMEVVSNASCTVRYWTNSHTDKLMLKLLCLQTNCLAPLAKLLNDNFGIESALMTTVHASTASNQVLDGFNKKSKRLGRAVATNIIPSTTGAAAAIRLVLPELDGKFTGISVRVPVNNVSMVDLSVTFSKPIASKEELLQPLRDAAEGRTMRRLGPLTDVIAVNDEELVSHDFLGWTQSCIVDTAATLMLNSTTAKIIAWYDNGAYCNIRPVLEDYF